MGENIIDYMIEKELKHDRRRAIGEAIGTGLVFAGRLTVFIIVLHFAFKYW